MKVPSGLLTITTDDFNWRKNGSLSIRAYLVGVLLLAEMPVVVFIEESAAARNSLEELFLPPFMRYASEGKNFGCICLLLKGLLELKEKGWI